VVRVYLDASVLVALFYRDSLSARADKWLQTVEPIVIVSDFAAAEFSSGVARLVRTEQIALGDARILFSNFDAWTARCTESSELVTADVAAAQAFLRRLDLTLRTPDALNIAIAMRLDAELATFDEKMALCARTLGVSVAAV
jgi:predicted nucleic acid-binding protein